jgi:hypothetical protein
MSEMLVASDLAGIAPGVRLTNELASGGFSLDAAQPCARSRLSLAVGLPTSLPVGPFDENINRESLGPFLLSDSVRTSVLSTAITALNELPQPESAADNSPRDDRDWVATAAGPWVSNDLVESLANCSGQSSGSSGARAIDSNPRADATAEIGALVAQFRAEGRELTDSAGLFPWGDQDMPDLFGPGDVRRSQEVGPSSASSVTGSAGAVENPWPRSPTLDVWAGPGHRSFPDPASPGDVGSEPFAELTARLLQTAERLEAAALRLASPIQHRPPALRPFRGRVDG